MPEIAVVTVGICISGIVPIELVNRCLSLVCNLEELPVHRCHKFNYY